MNQTQLDRIESKLDTVISLLESKRKKQSVNSDSIELRRAAFIDKVTPYINAYGEELVTDFITYWTFIKPKGRTMAFERQNSFVIELRLKTWFRNKQKRNGNNSTRTFTGSGPDKERGVKIYD